MAPVVRILARVLAGFLIGSGYFTEDTANAVFDDPAFDAAIGAMIWAVTELYYVAARKLGWRT